MSSSPSRARRGTYDPAESSATCSHFCPVLGQEFAYNQLSVLPGQGEGQGENRKRGGAAVQLPYLALGQDYLEDMQPAESAQSLGRSPVHRAEVVPPPKRRAGTVQLTLGLPCAGGCADHSPQPLTETLEPPFYGPGPLRLREGTGEVMQAESVLAGPPPQHCPASH